LARALSYHVRLFRLKSSCVDSSGTSVHFRVSRARVEPTLRTVRPVESAWDLQTMPFSISQRALSDSWASLSPSLDFVSNSALSAIPAATFSSAFSSSGRVRHRRSCVVPVASARQTSIKNARWTRSPVGSSALMCEAICFSRPLRPQNFQSGLTDGSGASSIARAIITSPVTSKFTEVTAVLPQILYAVFGWALMETFF